jgi:hypothetical protein
VHGKAIPASAVWATAQRRPASPADSFDFSIRGNHPSGHLRLAAGSRTMPTRSPPGKLQSRGVLGTVKASLASRGAGSGLDRPFALPRLASMPVCWGLGASPCSPFRRQPSPPAWRAIRRRSSSWKRRSSTGSSDLSASTCRRRSAGRWRDPHRRLRGLPALFQRRFDVRRRTLRRGTDPAPGRHPQGR